MDIYKQASEQAARTVTEHFSTSFSMATKSFPVETRQAIYNIYGMVRIADEIVDTYQGDDKERILKEFAMEVLAAKKRGYSSNIIIHAFALTAIKYDIGSDVIVPFFRSMAMDLKQVEYSQKSYETYIHGSAEVVGLMCLKVFCKTDQRKYDDLKKGASALGAAFQKVNFLRDLADDHRARGRYYFPIGSFEKFDKKTKDIIVKDIQSDIAEAKKAIKKLPIKIGRPIGIACAYYERLLEKLDNTDASYIKRHRVSVPSREKYFLFAKSYLRRHR